MLLIISPSKTQEFNGRTIEKWTRPQFLPQVRELSARLAEMNRGELAELMKMSPKLAKLTFQRYQEFSFPFTLENSRQALLVFRGDQFRLIRVDQYKEENFFFAQNHLRILSGLYGILRPLDLMQPYRLEMATRLPMGHGTTLYAYWGDMITEHLRDVLAGGSNSVLVNLASDEYFKAVRPAVLKYPVLKIFFKELKNGRAQVVAVYAKRARGMMVDYVIRHRINKPELLKKFNRDGYSYSRELSREWEWTFVRKVQ